jgi:hypothetical protein
VAPGGVLRWRQAVRRLLDGAGVGEFGDAGGLWTWLLSSDPGPEGSLPVGEAGVLGRVVVAEVGDDLIGVEVAFGDESEVRLVGFEVVRQWGGGALATRCLRLGRPVSPLRRR